MARLCRAGGRHHRPDAVWSFRPRCRGAGQTWIQRPECGGPGFEAARQDLTFLKTILSVYFSRVERRLPKTGAQGYASLSIGNKITRSAHDGETGRDDLSNRGVVE